MRPLYYNNAHGDAAGLAAGLVTVAAWGSAFVAIRAAGEALSPGSVALGRLLVSCAVLGAVAFGGCVLIGLATSRSGERATVGIVLCVIAAIAYATAVVVQKPVLARVSSFQVTWIGCAAAGGALCLAGVYLARRR